MTKLKASKEYVRKVVKLTNKHLKKHSFKKMSIKELDKFCDF